MRNWRPEDGAYAKMPRFRVLFPSCGTFALGSDFADAESAAREVGAAFEADRAAALAPGPARTSHTGRCPRLLGLIRTNPLVRVIADQAIVLFPEECEAPFEREWIVQEGRIYGRSRSALPDWTFAEILPE